jgi:hypothetical protein
MGGEEMNDALPLMFQDLSRSQVRTLLRKERHRVRFDAAVALVFTLAFGWIYAQLARGIGLPPHWIGLTAIGVQLVTFPLGMWARPSDYFIRRERI